MNAQLLEDEGLGPDPPHRDRLRSKEELSQAEKVKLNLDLDLGWEGRVGCLHQCWDGGPEPLVERYHSFLSCNATPLPVWRLEGKQQDLSMDLRLPLQAAHQSPREGL